MVLSGRQSVEAAWNVYKSAGYSHYEASFKEYLTMFDDLLLEMK